MGGSGGAVIAAAGELSGSDKVAMWGSSLSLNSERPSGAAELPVMTHLGLDIPWSIPEGPSRGSDGPALVGKLSSIGRLSMILEFLRGTDWEAISGEAEGSLSSADRSSPLISDSLSSLGGR